MVTRSYLEKLRSAHVAMYTPIQSFAGWYHGLLKDSQKPAQNGSEMTGEKNTCYAKTIKSIVIIRNVLLIRVKLSYISCTSTLHRLTVV